MRYQTAEVFASHGRMLETFMSHFVAIGARTDRPTADHQLCAEAIHGHA